MNIKPKSPCTRSMIEAEEPKRTKEFSSRGARAQKRACSILNQPAPHIIQKPALPGKRKITQQADFGTYILAPHGKRKLEQQEADPSASKKFKSKLDKADVEEIIAKKYPPSSVHEKNLIIKKYNEIKEKYSSFETKRGNKTLLNDREMLNIAIYCISTLPKIARIADQILLKQETGLARDIQISKEGAFLLPEDKLSKIQGSGTFKTASSLLALESTRKYALLKTKQAEDMKPATRTKTIQEGEMQYSLLGQRGIAPCHAVINYENGQIGFIIEEADGAIHNLLFQAEDTRITTQKTKTSLDIDQQFIVISDLAVGLKAAHDKGIIHGDIKGQNIVFTKDENDRIVKVGLTDFGEGFYYVQGEENQWKKSEEFEVGIYGTVGYTPPELLGKNREFDGDFFKTDIWAQGMVFYQMHFGEDPPWKEKLNQYNDTNFNVQADRFPDNKVLKKIRADFKRSVTETIENKHKLLSRKENRDANEEIELLICDMLRINPEERIDSSTMVKRIALIQKKLNQNIQVPDVEMNDVGIKNPKHRLRPRK